TLGSASSVSISAWACALSPHRALCLKTNTGRLNEHLSACSRSGASDGVPIAEARIVFVSFRRLIAFMSIESSVSQEPAGRCEVAHIFGRSDEPPVTVEHQDGAERRRVKIRRSTARASVNVFGGE